MRPSTPKGRAATEESGGTYSGEPRLRLGWHLSGEPPPPWRAGPQGPCQEGSYVLERSRDKLGAMSDREAGSKGPEELQPAQRELFISYHSSDAEYALWLRRRLEPRGWRAFVAHEDLTLRVGSDEWSKAIDDVLDKSQALILVVTPAALASQWVQYEWRSVHNDILAGRKGMLIPVCFEGLACQDLPRALRRYQCVDLRDPEKREVAVEDVFELLQGYLRTIEPAPASPQAPPAIEPPAAQVLAAREWRKVLLATIALLLLAFTGYWLYTRLPRPDDSEHAAIDQEPTPDLKTDGDGDGRTENDTPSTTSTLGVLIVPVATRRDPEPFPSAELRKEIVGPWPTGSLVDYFKEVSRGHLALDLEVLDWIRPAQSTAQLKPDDYSDWAQLFRSILGTVDQRVAMDRLDHNADGALDLVIFVLDRTWPSGGNSELAGPWPISWSFASRDLPAFFSADRKNGEPIVVDDFAVLPGIGIGPDRSMIEIGPFTRKVGIALGLLPQSGPGPEIDGPIEGLWSPMSNGSWGARPTHFSGVEKLLLGWVQAQDAGSLVHLEPVQTKGEVARIDTGDGGYLVLENRRRSGFDDKLPGEGLLIWQVSGSRIRLIEADGRKDLENNRNLGEATDPFPQPGQSAVRVGNVRLRKIRELPGGNIQVTVDRLSGEDP
jgi:TIR domain